MVLFSSKCIAAAALLACSMVGSDAAGQDLPPETIHEALGLAVPQRGSAQIREGDAARGTLGCPQLEPLFCQCPDFRTAFNISDYTRYEKIFLNGVAPSLTSIDWSEVYGVNFPQTGSVFVTIFDDDNGLPGNVIWSGDTGAELNLSVTPTGDQLASLFVYDVRVTITGQGAGFPNLTPYTGQCIHIGIGRDGTIGTVFWLTSNSPLGDNRHYRKLGTELPEDRDIFSDDLHICLDLATGSPASIAGSVLLACPPPECALEEPLSQLILDEGEADCGQPTDTVNGGCESASFLTTPLSNALYGRGTVFGVPDDGTGSWSRDTDYWLLSHDGGELKVGIYTDFVAELLILEALQPCPYTSSSAIARRIVPECSPQEYSAGVQLPGDYIVFVAQEPFADFRTLACGEGNYVVWDAGRDSCPVDMTGDGAAGTGDLLRINFVMTASDTEIAPASDAWRCDVNDDDGIDLRDLARLLSDPCSQYSGGTASNDTGVQIDPVSVDNSAGASGDIDPATDSTWDLQASILEGGGEMNAFAAAEIDIELTEPGFEFYQNSFGEAIYGEPNPALFTVFPGLEFDTFVCVPGDLDNGPFPDSVAEFTAPGQPFYELTDSDIQVRWSGTDLRFNTDGTFARLTIRNTSGDGRFVEILPQGTQGAFSNVIGSINGSLYLSGAPDDPVAFVFDIVATAIPVTPACEADPLVEDVYCLCPDFIEPGFFHTGFTFAEKVHLTSTSASLQRLLWTGGYVGNGELVPGELGNVVLSIYTDGEDGLPQDLIYFATDTQGLVVTQEPTTEPGFGFGPTYEFTVSFTSMPPDLSAQAGSCVHIAIAHFNVPGGNPAAWLESTSASGDGQFSYRSANFGPPNFIQTGSDLAICLDLIERDHILSDSDICPNLPFGCEGDANGDELVDVNDISYVLFRLGDPCPAPGCDGDANRDGTVDVNDISYVLFRLGNPC